MARSASSAFSAVNCLGLSLALWRIGPVAISYAATVTPPGLEHMSLSVFSVISVVNCLGLSLALWLFGPLAISYAATVPVTTSLHGPTTPPGATQRSM